MIRNETLRILEFDKILATIAGFANSDATRREIMALRPLHDRQEIERRFGQGEEIRRLAQLGIPVRLSPFADIAPAMEMIRPAGAMSAKGESRTGIPS